MKRFRIANPLTPDEVQRIQKMAGQPVEYYATLESENRRGLWSYYLTFDSWYLIPDSRQTMIRLAVSVAAEEGNPMKLFRLYKPLPPEQVNRVRGLVPNHAVDYSWHWHVEENVGRWLYYVVIDRWEDVPPSVQITLQLMLPGTAR